ncbi:MAG: methyltransferase domain-containing protein [Clostridiales Family XIII bacterium]|jgi:23S rRNA (guanine745-N1)-methyltransferase|nr:methyltransferase domain-containing protein [Clostridiales Family XIII bacterium]
MLEQKRPAQAKIGKLERLKTLLARDPGTLACPDCGAALLLARESSALRCARGHCYDLARKGYANLLGRGGGARGVYGPALFASRRAVFGFGFYEEAARRLAALAGELLRPGEAARRGGAARPFRALDAGCGEGYYAFALSRDASLSACRFYGLDLSKDAVAAAAGYAADIAWIVGDLARPPFRDGAFDLVLNVLSPAGYAAFRRILAPDGVLIKVLPGRDYLQELRALCGYQDRERGGGGEAAAHCERHMRVTERARIRYVCAPQAEQKKALPAMTPLTAGKHIDPAALETLRRITIDLEIIAGRPL